MDLGLDKRLEKFITEQEFKRPTSVQIKTIPEFLKKQNMMVVAATGTGKTFAYGLPLFQKVKEIEEIKAYETNQSAPFALILAPTRELASQINRELKKINHHLKLRVRLMSGGMDSTKVKAIANAKYEILVATPTRILSMVKRKELSLGCVEYFILDEADQLFDMGFNRDIEKISHLIKEDAHISLFSATFAKDVEEFAFEKLADKNVKKITFEDTGRLNDRVDTFNIQAGEDEKMKLLKHFIQKDIKGRGILFCNQKHTADKIYNELATEFPKLKIKPLHGDLTAKERAANFKSFNNKKVQFIIATDIAARGIDAKDLTWIINYELPKTVIYYLHRCGRVARAGKKGAIYNFLSNIDQRRINAINESIKTQANFGMDLISLTKKPKKKKASKTKKPPVAKKVAKRAARDARKKTSAQRAKSQNKRAVKRIK
jgi:superfamily II DNA/RNA helicase